MSNSQAWPIVRTDRIDEAYRIAQRLIGLAEVPGGEVDFRALTLSHPGLAR